MCLRFVFLLITRVAAWLRLSRREVLAGRCLGASRKEQRVAQWWLPVMLPGERVGPDSTVGVAGCHGPG
jgi:hypothetical protein